MGLGARVLAVYQPLAWVLLEIENSIWGLEPWGYHFTSLILHAINAILVYRLLLLFLAPSEDNRGKIELCAVFAAAFWALHPLRTEVVAWASCQPYIPACTFFLLSIAAYLESGRSANRSTQWLFLSWLFFLVALLFKAVAMSLTLVLILIDFYYFDRMKRGNWRRALVEKIPFAILTVVFLIVAGFSRAEYRLADTAVVRALPRESRKPLMV